MTVYVGVLARKFVESLPFGVPNCSLALEVEVGHLGIDCLCTWTRIMKLPRRGGGCLLYRSAVPALL